jgi:hypothetical protein
MKPQLEPGAFRELPLPSYHGSGKGGGLPPPAKTMQKCPSCPAILSSVALAKEEALATADFRVEPTATGREFFRLEGRYIEGASDCYRSSAKSVYMSPHIDLAIPISTFADFPPA